MLKAKKAASNNGGDQHGIAAALISLVIIFAGGVTASKASTLAAIVASCLFRHSAFSLQPLAFLTTLAYSASGVPTPAHGPINAVAMALRPVAMALQSRLNGIFSVQPLAFSLCPGGVRA